jgi:hypothetical protein
MIYFKSRMICKGGALKDEKFVGYAQETRPSKTTAAGAQKGLAGLAAPEGHL